jgi:uroporphyrinogen-III synthase
MSSGALDAALFFSPRSASVFRDCVVNAGLDVGSLIAICISEATASALAPLAFREVRIAEAPNQDALLGCIE